MTGGERCILEYDICFSLSNNRTDVFQSGLWGWVLELSIARYIRRREAHRDDNRVV
jgi:hypothetical protein